MAAFNPQPKPLPGQSLTAQDYAALEARWIDPDTARRQFLRRVNHLDGAELLGRHGRPGDCSGIAIPYFWPGEAGVRDYRVRRDHPEMENGKPRGKYLAPPGRRNMLYFPAGTDPAWLSDATLPLIITEGEFKTIALSRAATHGGTDPRPQFVAAGLGGVDSWHGTIGKTTDAGGRRVDEKGVIPDFDRLAWTGRRVTILFDVNVVTNPHVSWARRELARELTRRGAEVWLAELPPATGVNGCDDFLALYGPEKFAAVLSQAHRYQWREELLVSDKGKILRVLENAIIALRGAPEWVGVLGYDEFHLRTSALQPAPWGATGKWTEQDDRLATGWLQQHGILVSLAETAAAVETVARDRPFHPVREYLDALEWDGTGRLDDWLTLYLGAEASDVTRAFGAKWMLSAVARIYQPGCKADCCLIAEGPQGSFKSTAFRVLAEPWFTDDIAELGSKDAALSTIGAWVIELAELDAMTRADRSHVKAFISRNEDRFRPPYGRRLIDSPRQCVFVGTVNLSEYLLDETGGRRFWPFACGRIDLQSLRRDRKQLWAEAVDRYRAGEHWWLETSELNQAAAVEQAARYPGDAWEALIAKWLHERALDVTRPAEVTTAEVLTEALHKPAGTWTRSDETRVGIILRQLNWVPSRRPQGTTRVRMYKNSKQ